MKKKAPARRKKSRPSARKKHTAKASIQIHGLSKAGTAIELEIYADGTKAGRLVIGRGSVTWYGNKWHRGRRLPWGRFVQLMEA
jgi:hypothetical protein